MAMDEPLVSVGQITAPHGVRGEVRVFPLTDDPQRFRSLTDAVLGEDARPVRVSFRGIVKNLVILHIEGVADRNAAEKLRGAYLRVPRSRVHPLPPDSYYVFDLVGLTVRGEDGSELGTLAAVETLPAHDLYVVRQPNGKLFRVPAVAAFIVRIDLPGRQMVIRPVPGLIEAE
jgi:16S rRNA processing protein RimM